MVVSELIKVLESRKKEHGDIKILITCPTGFEGSDSYELDDDKSIWFEEMKRSKDLELTKFLSIGGFGEHW